jgi:hypothetical protein
MNLNRRSFLQGALSAPVFANLVACASDPEEPKFDPIERVRRDVHFALPQVANWTPAEQDQLELKIGDVSFPVKRHTVESLQGALKDTASDLLGTLDQPTHWVDDAVFSAEGVQMYTLGVPDGNFGTVPLVLGLHVPPVEQSSVPGVAATLGSAGSEFLGAENPMKDGFLARSEEACALWVVFTKPPLMSLDPEVAARVLAAIRNAQGFRVLADKIRATGRAVTLEQSKPGGSGKVGWITQRYLFDDKGQKIPEIQFTGEPLVVDGQQVYKTALEVNPEVAALAQIVADNAMILIQSDPVMEGVKHVTNYGSGLQDLTLAAANGELSEISSALLGSAAGAASESKQTAARYRYAQNGQVRDGRKFEVHHHEGQKFEIKYTSRAPVSTWCAVQPFFVDKDGKEKRIPNGSKSLGYVPGVTWFGLSLAFDSFKSQAEFDYTLTPETSRVELWNYAPAFRVGDAASRDDDFMIRIGYPLINWVMSLIFDYGIPLYLLVHGIAGANKIGGYQDLAKEIGKDFLKEGGVELVKALLAFFTNDPEGNRSLEELLKDLGKALLQQGATFIFKALVAVGLGRIAASLTKFLIKTIVIRNIEKAAIAALPVVGQAIIAATIALQVAQLGAQGVYAATSEIKNRSELVPLHPVKVTVKPDATKFNFFPEGVVEATITLTAEDRKAVAHTFPFDPRGMSSGAFDFPVGIELGGKLKCNVEFFNRTGEKVGAGETIATNANRVDELQTVDVLMVPIPVQITPTTTLTHSRKLTPSRDARRFVNSAVAPPLLAQSCNDVTYCGSASIALNQTQPILGYAFRTKFPGAAGKVATQVHLAPFVVKEGDVVPVERYVEGIGFAQVLLPRSNGRAFLIAPAPTADKKDKEIGDATFGVYPLDFEARKLPNTFAENQLIGTFLAETIERAKLHSAGVVVAITGGKFFEAIRPSKEPGFPAAATILNKRGALEGQLDAPVSLCPLALEHAVYILEAGQSRRVQCFDFLGNPIIKFNGKSTFALRAAADYQYLDIEEDALGNIWVLGKRTQDHFIDVYNPSGERIVEFPNVNALSLAIDDATTVYTVNAESVRGPADYPEPTLSIWTPQNPKKA